MDMIILLFGLVELLRLFQQVRGPFGAAILSLARLGWRFSSAVSVVVPGDEEFLLTSTSPKLLQWHAQRRRSVEAHLQQAG